MLTLSIIGCGNVAKTLAYLWHQKADIEIKDVVNRSQESANASVTFIGAGNALGSLQNIRQADIYAIGCGDDHIETCLDALLEQNVVKENTTVFHFSGAKSSAVLDKAKQLGANCASLHPVKSFADPRDSINTFSNTYCGLEGDKDACDILSKLIKTIGGHSFNVKTDKKLIYHAASVFACNYLTVLQELSINAFQHSGVERELAMKILEPIVKETSSNIFKLGTADALTGPIARGDHQLVTKQLEGVLAWDNDAAEVYRLLGKLSVELSDLKGASEKEKLALLRKLLS